jgi:hypothetical protein
VKRSNAQTLKGLAKAMQNSVREKITLRAGSLN